MFAETTKKTEGILALKGLNISVEIWKVGNAGVLFRFNP